MITCLERLERSEGERGSATTAGERTVMVSIYTATVTIRYLGQGVWNGRFII